MRVLLVYFYVCFGIYSYAYANIQLVINDTISEKNNLIASRLSSQQTLQLSFANAVTKSQNETASRNNLVNEINDLSSRKLISFAILHTTFENLETGLISYAELDRLKPNARNEYLVNCKALQVQPNPADVYVGNRGICVNRERIDFFEICHKQAICNYDFTAQYYALLERMGRKEFELQNAQIETERAQAALNNITSEIAILRLQISNLKNLSDQFFNLLYFTNIKKLFGSQLKQFSILENFFLNNDHNSAIDILLAMNSSYEKLLKTESNNRVVNQINISKQFNLLLINNLKNSELDIKYYTDNLSKMKNNYREILKISSDEFSRQYIATAENINGLNDNNLRNRFLDELEKYNRSFENE